MLRQHLHSWNAHSLVKGECFTQRIGRRPIHRRMVLVPINAVKDRVEEDRLTNGKKGAPDMNAAVTSAIEAQKSEKASKRQKRRHTPRRKEKKAETEQESVKQSGPASRLTNRKATKKRKKPSRTSPEDRTVRALTSEPLKKNSLERREAGQEAGVTLNDLNPYEIGRRSRAVLESVWRRFSNLSAPGRATVSRETLDTFSGVTGSSAEFETPQAAVTNVLVIGATGKVGRILVRKLLLRGYPVTALVRSDSPRLNSIPKAVRLVKGDIGEYQDLRKAMENIDKVIFCASSRTAITADVKRVSHLGIQLAAKALQDERLAGITTSEGSGLQPFTSARIKLAGGHQRDKHSKNPSGRWEPWEVLHVGPTRESKARAEARAKRYTPTNLDRVELWINKRNNLVFQGMLINRSAYAATGFSLDTERKGLRGTVGLVIRVKGDGLPYSVTLTTEKGSTYVARFNTNSSFQNIRIPYSAFRKNEGTSEDEPQILEPQDIRQLGLMAEYRNRSGSKQQSQGRDLDSLMDRSDKQFKLEVNRIHALPAGTETDFILVSCAGVVTPGVDEVQQDSVTAAKRLGEASLKTSGLAYTIVRPGPIIDEPGGYKALVFDQGNRISQSISRADVADVCLKALHDEAARNKTFEVCHESASENERFELMAHFPDKANSYLTPALSSLERET